MTPRISVVAVLLAYPGQALGFDYVLGTESHATPAMAKPAKGVPVIHPAFNTEITRVTDLAIDQYDGPGILVPYSMGNPANADDTYLTLKSGSRWYVYHGPESPTPYVLAREIPEMEGSQHNPHWDNEDPHRLYFLQNKYTQIRSVGPRLYAFDVETGVASVVHDFKTDPELQQWFTGANDVPCGADCYGHFIETGEYIEPSWDTRTWSFWIMETLAGGGNQIKAAVTYDRQEDRILAVLTSPDDIFLTNKGVCSTTAFGTYVGIRSGTFSARYWDRELTAWSTETHNNGHSDLALDVRGREVEFLQHTTTDHFALFDIAEGAYYGLHPCGGGTVSYSPGIHPSGNGYAKPGWGAISTYGESGLWMDGQIFMMELDAEKAVYRMLPNQARENLTPPATATIWRLAHTHATGDRYDDQPHATVSRSGKYVYWQSNWDGSGPVEVYQVALPSTWHEDLSGFNITTSVLQEGTVGVEYRASLQAVGGTPPYRWELSAGALPEGLQLLDNAITGAPTQEGTFELTVNVRDSSTPSDSVSRELTLVVAPAELPDGPVQSESCNCNGASGVVWVVVVGLLGRRRRRVTG